MDFAEGFAFIQHFLYYLLSCCFLALQPFFKFAASKAREMMIKRGDLIGFPWEPALRELKKHDWDAEVAAVAVDSRVPRQANGEFIYPEYYLKPFHAYENGNLSLDVALEFELAAKAVHAPIFDPEVGSGKEMMHYAWHRKHIFGCAPPHGAKPAVLAVFSSFLSVLLR